MAVPSMFVVSIAQDFQTVMEKKSDESPIISSGSSDSGSPRTESVRSGIQYTAMTSTSQAPVRQGKRGSIGSYIGGGNASLLIEKAKGVLRRSTSHC
jgi:hypothetical protein